MLPKAIRLPTQETTRILHTGRRFTAVAFRFAFEKNDRGTNRYSIIGRSKKIGGAVARSQTKRLIREYLRTRGASVPQGYDCIITCLAPILKSEANDVTNALHSYLTSLFTEIR